MAITIATIKDRAFKQYNDSSENFVTDFVQYFNRAKDELIRHAKWPFLKATGSQAYSANATTVALPSNIQEDGLRKVWVNKKQEAYLLTELTDDGWFELNHASTDTATDPTGYRRNTSNLELYPIPSTADTLYFEYTKTISDITEDSTTITLPAEVSEWLLFKLIQYFYEQEADFNTAAIYAAKAKRELADVERLLIPTNDLPMTRGYEVTYIPTE